MFDMTIISAMVVGTVLLAGQMGLKEALGTVREQIATTPRPSEKVQTRQRSHVR